jgi:hypothetical protein
MDGISDSISVRLGENEAREIMPLIATDKKRTSCHFSKKTPRCKPLPANGWWPKPGIRFRKFKCLKMSLDAKIEFP